MSVITPSYKPKPNLYIFAIELQIWLSMLEASYIILLLRPHHKNFRKRLIKSPKRYFIDVGLAAYLLDIQDETHVKNHPLRGFLFETFIVAEILKKRFNNIKTHNLYYFRDNVGNEVDVLMDMGSEVIPIEIKSGQTMNDEFLKGLNYYRTLNPTVKQSWLSLRRSLIKKYLPETRSHLNKNRHEFLS